MIEKLITIALIELIIVLGMWIISLIFANFFYEEQSYPQSYDFAMDLTDEQAEKFKKIFNDNNDD